ncbi:MAG: hypothetical protein ACW981_01075 [Candidatus Hodarchaeales archaeon]|jgi:hypothetical protein
MADIDFDKAMGFINKFANAIDKARYYIYYMDEVPKTHKETLMKLINSRKEKELFPLDYDSQFPYSVISTVYFILHFQDAVLLMEENYLISELVSAILPFQQADGSWSETPELLNWNEKPEWVDTNDEDVKIWISCLVTSVLSTLPSSFVPIPIIKKGIEYLQKQIDNENGGFIGFVHSTFIASPLIYSRMIGKKDFIEKSHNLMRLQIEENDYGGTLGSFLESLSSVTSPKVRPLFIDIFRKIKNLQLEDGSFFSEEGEDEKHRSHATIQMLIGYLKAEERIKTFQKPKFSANVKNS